MSVCSVFGYRGYSPRVEKVYFMGHWPFLTYGLHAGRLSRKRRKLRRWQEDNSDSYKQGVQCRICGNHGNHDKPMEILCATTGSPNNGFRNTRLNALGITDHTPLKNTACSKGIARLLWEHMHQLLQESNSIFTRTKQKQKCATFVWNAAERPPQ